MASKKTFRDTISNPAISFISQESIEKAEGEAVPDTEQEIAAAGQGGKAPKGYKLNPQYVETRSHRLQVLLQPTLYEKLKNKATREETSVNDVIHTILTEAMREEK